MSVNSNYFGPCTIATSISSKSLASPSKRVKKGSGLHLFSDFGGNILSVSSNDVLNTVRLTEPFGKPGKEADVYTTNAKIEIDGYSMPLLAKIYKKTSERLKAKTQLFCSKKLYHKGIAFPVGWLSRETSEDKFCYGILMPQVPESATLFSYIKKETPFEERMRIAKLTVDNFKFLYNNSIQPVDFNENNFLVSKQGKDVWLIDCDSFQIGNFPCTVAAPSMIYDNPWRMKQGFYNYSVYLRYKSELTYSLCVLLFKVLFNNPPYYVVEEGTDIHNIMEGNYLFMNGKTNKTNLSLWRECPKHIQNLFNHVFHPKGKFFYAKNPIEEYSLKFSIVANCFD